MNNSYRLILVIVCIHLVAVAFAGETGQLRENRQELQRIKSQLDETQTKVDSLKDLENQIQKEIANYGERVTRNKRLVDRLHGQLKQVQSELANNSNNLDETSSRLEQKQQRYSAMLVDYYRQRNDRTYFHPWNFDDQLRQKRTQRYLSAISGRSTEEIVQVGDSVKLLSQHIDSLTATGSDLDKLRREKKARIDLDLTLKDKEEASLGNVRRQTNILQDRLVSLSAAAREMEDIIASLEQAQRRRRQAEGPPVRFREGSFSQLKGYLTPPVKGKVVESFGWKTNSITNLKSFSPGIGIKPAKSSKYIVACAPGRVAYVGRMRGYSNFVILEHDDGYYTTYAGMSSSLVELDDLIDAGEKIGVKGDKDFHFELRKGREHLDPVIWLDIDAL